MGAIAGGDPEQRVFCTAANNADISPNRKLTHDPLEIAIGECVRVRYNGRIRLRRIFKC